MSFHDVMTPCMNSFTANPFEINKLTSLAMNGNPAPCLHVEVSLKHSTRLASLSGLESSIRDHLRFSELVVSENGSLEVDSFHEDPLLSLHVCAMTVFSEDLDSSSGRSVGGVRLNEASLRIYLFELDEHGSSYENLAEESDGSSPTPAAVHWMLPSLELHRQWENLIYEDNVKSKLLNFTHTALRFSDKKVDPNKISWNRVVLLHGPPGTGKTSLCRAVAHKLSIRLGSRYTHGQLVEINSHSLFSKWFSESGKLVHQMFEKIREMVEEKEALVCVLIDEVESLATSRTSSGSEPGDALRVVNAMLTALDSIKDYPNVIIFTTSNITGSIDNAFVDRADIKHYIGHPTKNAIYQILQSSIEELMKKGIIELQEKCLPLSTFKVYQNDSSRKLMSLAESAEGLSGRTLKKLPFLAAAHLFASGSGSNSLFKLVDFLDAMVIAVKEQHTERENLTKTS